MTQVHVQQIGYLAFVFIVINLLIAMFYFYVYKPCISHFLKTFAKSRELLKKFAKQHCQLAHNMAWESLKNIVGVQRSKGTRKSGCRRIYCITPLLLVIVVVLILLLLPLIPLLLKRLTQRTTVPSYDLTITTPVFGLHNVVMIRRRRTKDGSANIVDIASGKLSCLVLRPYSM